MQCYPLIKYYHVDLCVFISAYEPTFMNSCACIICLQSPVSGGVHTSAYIYIWAYIHKYRCIYYFFVNLLFDVSHSVHKWTMHMGISSPVVCLDF